VDGGAIDRVFHHAGATPGHVGAGAPEISAGA
jgi:hypothetical protein